MIFTEARAEKLLKKYAPVAKSILVHSEDQLHAAAKKIKYPLVLKIISKQALHKTDIGGVKIVHDKEELEKAHNSLVKLAIHKKIHLEGVLVQEFVEGEEVIIGIKNDPAFGHVIAFGIGGKYVEVIKDITFRVCPINTKDADSMISDLKYRKILFGARGKPVNINLLKKTLVKISKLPSTHRNLEELDINPFIINDKEGKVVDARMSMK